jgi:hypothetical protein
MAAPYFWSNVSISLESVLGSALTISAITKDNPGVATSTAHGLDDGDFVYIAAEGMVQADGIVVRVDDKANDTFDLEGVNTTNYDTFSSGTAQLITFGSTLSNVTGVQVSGGDAQFEEWALIQDNVRRRAPVSYNPWSLQFECLWDPADATLLALKGYADTFEEKAVKIAMSGGYPLIHNSPLLGGLGYRFHGFEAGDAADAIMRAAAGEPMADPADFLATLDPVGRVAVEAHRIALERIMATRAAA